MNNTTNLDNDEKKGESNLSVSTNHWDSSFASFCSCKDPVDAKSLEEERTKDEAAAEMESKEVDVTSPVSWFSQVGENSEESNHHPQCYGSHEFSAWASDHLLVSEYDENDGDYQHSNDT